MALKTKDGMVRSESVCFTIDSRALGVTFELKDGMALFAPYAYLSHARLIGNDEIVFHFSFGQMTVRGLHLKEIFALLQKNEVSVIRCENSGIPQSGEPRVIEIVFDEGEDNG